MIYQKMSPAHGCWHETQEAGMLWGISCGMHTCSNMCSSSSQCHTDINTETRMWVPLFRFISLCEMGRKCFSHFAGHPLFCGLNVLATQHMKPSFWACLCAAGCISSTWVPFVYEFVCLFLCLCAYAQLMKLHLVSCHLPLFLLLLLVLMLSHFLWVPDKPTKQGENRALYWDACQDSPWIYGQQTAFITQLREAE